MSRTLVIVLNVEEEYEQAIAEYEERIEEILSMLPSRPFEMQIDDISTIDAIADYWLEWLKTRPWYPNDLEFRLLLTFEPDIDEEYKPVLDMYKKAGATIIVACTDEQKRSARFQHAWNTLHMDKADIWNNIGQYARWSVTTPGEIL